MDQQFQVRPGFNAVRFDSDGAESAREQLRLPRELRQRLVAAIAEERVGGASSHTGHINHNQHSDHG